jgi:hypothetical protein
METPVPDLRLLFYLISSYELIRKKQKVKTNVIVALVREREREREQNYECLVGGLAMDNRIRKTA